MKKGLIVLLVMVLVSSFAFAGSIVTGKFDTSFKFDLEEEEVYFANSPYAKLRLELNADTKSTANEGSVYAELKADIGLRTKFVGGSYKVASSSWIDATDYLQYRFNFNTAKIVGENWNVSILRTTGSTDFAYSTIDSDGWTADNGTYYSTTFGNMAGNISYTRVPGVEVTYDKYTVGVGFTKIAGVTDYTLAAKATDVAVADGIVASAGVGFSTQTAKTLAFGAKVVATTDVVDVTAAGDFGYLTEADSNAFKSEASLVVNVKAIENIPVTFDAYWLDNATVHDTDWNETEMTDKQVADYYGYTTTNKVVSKALTLKATTNVEGFDIAVKGKDLLNAKKLSGSVAYTYDVFDFEIGGGYGIAKKSYSAYLDATYNHDLFVAFVEAYYDNADGFQPTVKLTSTTLVSGAKLYLQWTGAAFGDTTTKGAVETGCTISF